MDTSPKRAVSMCAEQQLLASLFWMVYIYIIYIYLEHAGTCARHNCTLPTLPH